MTVSHRRRRSWLLPLVLLLGCAGYLLLANRAYTDDFRAFYLASKATLHHLDPYVNHDGLGSSYADPLWPWPDSRFLYPPTALFFFLPFALLPYGVAKVGFAATTVICVVLTILLLRKRLRTPDWAWALLFVSMPVFMCVDNGQIDCQLLLLLLAAFLIGDSISAGMLWGVAVAIKLSPILFALWWIGSRRWKTLAVGCVTVFLLASVAHFCWGRIYFAEFFQHFQRHAYWNALPVVPHTFQDLSVAGGHVMTPRAVYTTSHEFYGWFQNPLRHLKHGAQQAGLASVLAVAVLLFLTRRGKRLPALHSFTAFLAITPLSNPLLWPMGLAACLPFTAVLFAGKQRHALLSLLLLGSVLAPKAMIGNWNYSLWLISATAIVIIAANTSEVETSIT